MLAADLLASVFPDAAACLENIPGDRQIPDHPLVAQAVRDCLEEAMDLPGLNQVLDRIHRGELTLVARDTPEPSAFAHEILNSAPYAFLDDAPLEERRSHAVQTRRGVDEQSDGMGALDPAAIDRVRAEARPEPRSADELHDALMTFGVLRRDDLDTQSLSFLDELAAAGRACRCLANGSPEFMVAAAERLPELLAVHPTLVRQPRLEPPPSRAREWERDAALVELLRSRMCLAGPVTAEELANSLHITVADADRALLALEGDGAVLRGRFHPRSVAPGAPIEWCDRALLARIHRYTLNRLRAEIEPVTPATFMQFLFKWQHVDPGDRLTGVDGLREVLTMLDGFELAAGAWERAVLPARVDAYDPSMLDLLCFAGEVCWSRFSTATAELLEPSRLTPGTPIALFLREHASEWQALRPESSAPCPQITSFGKHVLDVLREKGASFFADLRASTGLSADDVRLGLGNLVANGLASSDGFAGLRALLASDPARPAASDRRATFAGRWSATATPGDAQTYAAAVETQAWALLRRYGVVFRRLLTRESMAAPWRDLARVYRRLEARGEIRGGHFVSGMSGEQFALPGAIERLREVRRSHSHDRITVIGTADPLNLCGIVTAGERIRASARNRLAYRNGTPVAVLEGGTVRILTSVNDASIRDVTEALHARVPRRAPVAASLATLPVG
jgi:ATP-dependent Lhr-like helicase